MSDSFAKAILSKVASSVGLSYEDMCKDYAGPSPPEPEADATHSDRTRIVLGGAPGGRPFEDEGFEGALNTAFGDRIRFDDEFAETVWGAITGLTWTAPDGVSWGFSYRAAGDIVAAIRGRGDYMRWYCSGPVFTDDCPSEIAAPLAALGWAWRKDDYE